MDLLTLVRQMMTDGTVQTIARNPLAQFGPPARQYLGATLLPERLVPLNAFRERNIRYRTVIANNGTRYSPAQKKDDNTIVGSMLVELAENDIAREFTGPDYDAFLELLMSRPTMEAVASLTRWLDVTVNRALLDLNEKQRWDAIVNASVVLSGDNGYTETVRYSNPSGHRVNAGGTWSSNSYDPYPDITAIVQKLTDKGYTVNRIITSRKVATILARNAYMQARAGARVIVTTGGNIQAQPSPLITLDQLNQVFLADGLPTMELYEAQYFDYAGAHRFLADTVMVFVATTGRDDTIVETRFYENGEVPILDNVLGYEAIGRPTGQAGPGRVILMEPKGNKPPRIEAEGWQTSLPVILEPEAIGIIKQIG
jgi:hypothetical protein